MAERIAFVCPKHGLLGNNPEEIIETQREWDKYTDGVWIFDIADFNRVALKYGCFCEGCAWDWWVEHRSWNNIKFTHPVPIMVEN
jgi:hypothetical protein